MGLADDGGLLLPETIPALTRGDVEALGKLAYPELAFQVISLFAGDIPSTDLKDLVERSYGTFSHPEVTPAVHRDGLYILELFHAASVPIERSNAERAVFCLLAKRLERVGCLRQLACTVVKPGQAPARLVAHLA